MEENIDIACLLYVYYLYGRNKQALQSVIDSQSWDFGNIQNEHTLLRSNSIVLSNYKETDAIVYISGVSKIEDIQRNQAIIISFIKLICLLFQKVEINWDIPAKIEKRVI